MMASSSSRLGTWDLVAVVCYFGAVLGVGLYVSVIRRVGRDSTCSDGTRSCLSTIVAVLPLRLPRTTVHAYWCLRGTYQLLLFIFVI